MILPLSLGAMVHTHLCLACGFAVGALTCPSACQDIASAKNPGVPDAELSFHSRGKAPPDLWWIFKQFTPALLLQNRTGRSHIA